MKISLPYGNEMVGMEVPDQCFIGMIDPPEAQPAGDPERVILDAIEHPIGGPKLEDIVTPDKRIAVIVDDGSRPTPISAILPVLLDQLIRCGARREQIKIFIALGSHRYMTEDEMR